MGPPIDFNEYVKKRDNEILEQKKEIIDHSEKQDIDMLIKRAQLIKSNPDDASEVIRRIGGKKLNNYFEGKISKVIFDQKLMATEYFLCGIYVSILLSDLLKESSIPESWFAIDYVVGHNKSNNPELLKKGADVCFLINTVFKERGDIRCMNYDDYIKIGQTLYRQFYNFTGKEIAFHMHANYEIMVGVTDECLKNL
jgi:hypothetical protein